MTDDHGRGGSRWRTLGAGALVLGGAAALRGRVRRDVPFSRLRARTRVGAGYLDRHDAVESNADRDPRGMVDDLDELATPGFDPGRVDGAVRAFYEDSADCTMDIRPEWPVPLRAAARVYHRVARHVGQLVLPVAPQTGNDRLTSQVVPVRAAVDGREGARAWSRRYPNGDAMYVAVYTTYARAGRSYLNVAFPLPGGNLSGILRAEHLGDGGLTLTSAGEGDEGLYLVRDGVGVRLPISEALRVWADPADGPFSPFDPDPAAVAEADAGTEANARTQADAGSVFARHDVWLGSARLFTLHYRIETRWWNG